MSGQVDVTIVSALYRTGQYVADLVDRVDTACTSHGLTWRMVLVDDACPEDSGRRATELHRSDVETVVLDANHGQQAATSAGIRLADGDTVVVMDSDLQDRPEDIPALVGAVTNARAIAAAGRRGSYSTRREWLTARMFRIVRWLVSMGDVPIDAGMFVAGPRPVMLEIATHGDPSVHFLSRAANAGVEIATIPLVRDRRTGAGGSYSFRDRARVARRAIGGLWWTPRRPANEKD